MASTSTSDEGLPKTKCVEDILTLGFCKNNTKINSDALKRTTELVKIFLTETATRAAIQAKSEGTDVVVVEVTPQHLEKILPQLLLDF